ncbi:MAG: histidine kinase [Prevotella sp.]|nr:histidine kinase [Prevotella sp.]
MNKKIENKDLWLLGANVAVWAVVLLVLPLATFLSTRDVTTIGTSFLVALRQFQSSIVVYFVNFYLLGPYLFFKRRNWWFVICNIVLILGLNSRFFLFYFNRPNIPHVHHMPGMDSRMWIGVFSGFLMFFVLNCVMAAIAIGIRHFVRIRQIKQQLKEEKAKNTEAELAWLKNQINPHFLFNTLNNISSLTQIDSDAAQDAIAQLSDLLRYAMYETNKKMVPIDGEINFMRNFIDLMKLRCNEKTSINAEFNIENAQLEVAPLLFISLIENAFKHGVSSNRPSTIDIHLEEQADQLVFTCDNTNYPKNDTDRSGSGIGLENTRRRLELVYHGRYEWEQNITPDNIYHVRITLKTIQ